MKSSVRYVIINYNLFSKIAKAMFKFFLFLFILFLPKILFGAPIKAIYELNYNPAKGLLQGRATFELEREGLYEFSVRDIRLSEVLLDNSSAKYSQREDKISLFNSKKNTSLRIQFERELPFKVYLNLQLVENYLPYPLLPSEYEISIKVSPKERISLIIPSEEREAKREEGTLEFKINKPLSQPPPLIIGNFFERAIRIDALEIIFLFPGREKLEESEWRNFENYFKGLITKLIDRDLFFPFAKFFVIVNPEKKTFPLTLALPLNLRDKEMAISLLRETLKHSLQFALNLRDSFLMEGFTLFLTDYWFSQNRVALRRDLISEKLAGGKAFYFFYERLAIHQDEEFISFLADYFKRALFSEVREDKLLKILSEKFGWNLPWPPQSDSFCRLDLKALPSIQYLEREQKFYLTLKLSSLRCFRPQRLKIQIHSPKETLNKVLVFDESEKTFTFYLNERPLYLVIDPSFEVYRTLSYSERSRNWESLLSGRGVLYLPKRELYPMYKDLIQELKEQGYQIRTGRPTLYELPEENLVFLELPPQGFHLSIPKEGFFLKALPHPRYAEKNMLIIKASSTKEMKEAWNRRQQWIKAEEVLLQRGKPLMKREPPVNSGIRIELSEIKGLSGIKTTSFLPFENLVSELLPYQVILIGENHDQYSHHQFQLELIKGLRAFTGDLAIGLEMVQRPFQKYLDDFVEGRLSERELLEKIEYYERWRFDWRLYREIFLYAKEKKIRLIALDMPQEIVKKVFREGLNSLSPKEKELLPELDLHNPAYEAYLRKSFEVHPFDNTTNFDFFYQAQALRDEGMAERILEFIRSNPQMKLVVLTGKGHLLYGHGIPYALKRRNFSSFKTVILGELEEPKAFAGDYWFVPPTIPYERTPQLGLLFEETDRGLRVKEILKESLGERGGLKVGDLILKIDGHPVKKVSSLKIILTFKRRGDRIVLEVDRDKKIEKFEWEIK